MQTQVQDTKTYITVTSGMIGWYAVKVWWNTEQPELGGFWEPLNAGVGRYRDRSGAEEEAIEWAEAEGLEYR